MILQSQNNKVSIRGIRIEDAEILMEMNNSDQIAQYVVGSPKKVTIEEQLKWMELIKNEKSTVRFMIDYEGNPVGTIILSDIDDVNQIANVNIKLLPETWGKGVGSLSLALVLQYCFDDMNMECLTAHVLSYNLASLALFKKNGFLQEGVLRRRVIKNGKRCDLVSLSLLKEEYKK